VAGIEGGLVLDVEDLNRGFDDTPNDPAHSHGLHLMAWAWVFAAAVAWVRGGRAAGVQTALALVALAYLYRWLPRRGQRRFAKVPEPERALRYRFDEQSVRVTSLASQVELPYAELNGYVAGKSTFLLYKDGRIAQTIPRRAFSEEQNGRILQLLAARLQRHAAPRPVVWLVPAAYFLVVFAIAGVVMWDSLRPKPAGGRRDAPSRQENTPGGR
jgi:YcxB-like protein